MTRRVLEVSRWRGAMLAGAALLCLTLGTFSCRVAPPVSPKASGAGAVVSDKILPRQVPGGISLLGKVEQYGPKDLWQKIDGAADLFISYGFKRLLTAPFARSGSPQLEVSLYDMGSDLNAMGVYLQERSEGEKAAIGWEGYKSGDGLFFHKGPYYVKIIDVTKDGTAGAAATDLAREIDKAINVKRQTLAEMEVFPTEGLVPDSILYEHRDAMGHGFLQRVFRANYTIGGKTATLFYCRQAGADQLLAKYRDYAKEFGKIEREWQDGDLRFLSLTAFNNPELIFTRGNVFGGVVGCPDQAATLRLIRALLKNVDRQLSR